MAGGGIDGMQAAETAAKNGHTVILCEKSDHLGGAISCEDKVPFKKNLAAYIRQQVSRGRKSMMSDALDGSAFKSKALKRALEEKDPVATEAVDRACHWLAVATGNLINTISPDLVLYGGGVIEALGDVFLQKILAEVDRYCMPQIRSTVEIKIAELGDDSILYGDLAMIKGL